MRRPWLSTALAILSLFVLASCDGFSCAGQGYQLGTNQDLPAEATLDPGLELRFTDEGAAFLSEQGPNLLRALLGANTGEWLDVSDLINAYLAANPISVLTVSAREVVASVKLPQDALEITFLDGPPRVRVRIPELWVRMEATMVDELTHSACRVRGDLAPGPEQRMLTITDLELDLILGADAAGFAVTTEIRSINIAGSGIDFVTDPADPWYYCNFPECADGLPPQCGECSVVCETGDFADDVANFVLEVFDDAIAAAVEIVANALLANVQSLGGQIHPALLMGSLLDDVYDSEPLALGLRPSANGFRVAPRPDLFGEHGDLEISLALGVDAVAVHPCVAPITVRPTFQASWLPQIPLVNAGPELATAIPAAFIDELVWSLYKSGALCLDIDSGAVHDLTGGSIDLSVGLLSLLLPGLEELAPADAPLLITVTPSLMPSDFPLVRFADPAESSGMIHVRLNRFAIGLYAFVDEQYVRLFEVSADLEVAVTPVILPDSSLGVGIDSVELRNLNETYDELFQQVELQELLSFVAELVTKMLVGNDIMLPLSLEDMLEKLLGLPLTLTFGDFAAVGAAKDWLSLSIGLAAATTGAPLVESVDTRSNRTHLEGVAGEPLWVPIEAGRTRKEIEAQWQLDGLGWSSFQPIRDGTIAVQSHLAKLPGAHRLRVRARYRGEFRSLDPTPLELALTLRSKAEAAAAPLPAPSDEPGSCSVLGLRSGGGTPFSLFLLGFVAWAVRRRRRMVLLAVGFAMVTLLGCDDEPVKQIPCENDRDCPGGQSCGCAGACVYPLRCASSSDCCGGRACIDGTCEARFECRIDDDCAADHACEGCQCRRKACSSEKECAPGSECRDGLCMPYQHAPCGGACTPDQVCLVERDLCIARSSMCPQLTCPEGEQAVFSEAAGLLGEQCSFEKIACGCVEGPPLREPAPGVYVSLAPTEQGFIVAAYEAYYGDLVVLEGPATDLGALTFLDGVPDLPATADPAGPRRGIGAKGDDVGRYVSAARAPDGTLAIASRDATRGALKLSIRTRGASTWSHYVVDDAGDAGFYVALQALSDSRFVVAYQALELRGASLHTELRVATSKFPMPTSGADFIVTLVESVDEEQSAAVCGGACSVDEVCTADAGTCETLSPPSDCAATCQLGTGCIDGLCTLIVSTSGQGPWNGTGVDPSVIPLGDGLRVAIPFYRAHTGSLAMAVGPASGPFNVRTVDEGTNRAGFGPTNVGRQVTGSVDGSGKLGLVYLDDTSGALLSATVDPTDFSLSAAAVVSPGQAANPGFHIGGVDAVRAPDGSEVVAFQDTSNGILLAARRPVGGEWATQVVDMDGASGISPALSATGTGVVVAFARIRAAGIFGPTRSVELKTIE